MVKEYNLDVDAPEKVPEVLHRVADAYRDSQSTLQSDWQDKNAGKIWGKIATILEKAADQINKEIAKGY